VNFSNDEVCPLEDIKFIDDKTIEITYISDNNDRIETKIIALR